MPQSILSLFETFFKKEILCTKLECRNKKQKATLIEDNFTHRPASNHQASLKKYLVHSIQQPIPKLQIQIFNNLLTN